MDAEKLHNGVESIKHPFQTGILAVRGLGHALEKRGGPISSQLGAGFVELVDPEVSILNLHNWGNTDREISAAQPTNFWRALATIRSSNCCKCCCS